MTFGSQVVAAYGLLDIPRPGAEVLKNDLSNTSDRVVMITGDNEGAAHRFAACIGLPRREVYSTCIPS